MDRRSFLTGFGSRTELHSNGGGQPRELSTGLEPYVPSASQPWDAIRAAHLLRRTTFLPRWSDVAALMAKSPNDAVDQLLNTASTPAEPPEAETETESLDGLDVILQGQVRGVWDQN